MKKTYPYVVFEKEGGDLCHTVYLPDFDSCTQGETLEECHMMAQDLLGLLLLSYSEDDFDVPSPYSGDVEKADIDAPIILEATVSGEFEAKN